MDMRVDAARDHDLPRGVDGPSGTDPREAPGRADRRNMLAGYADIGGLGPVVRPGMRGKEWAGVRKGKSIKDLGARDLMHDKDEPAAPILVRPIVEPFRRK